MRKRIFPAKVIEESVLQQVRNNCKLGKRHQQEHVDERLNRLVERVGYDGTSGRVTLNFRPAAGMGEPVLTYILGRVEKPAQMAEATHLPRVTRLLALALKCEGLVRSGTKLWCSLLLLRRKIVLPFPALYSCVLGSTLADRIGGRAG